MPKVYSEVLKQGGENAASGNVSGVVCNQAVLQVIDNVRMLSTFMQAQ